MKYLFKIAIICLIASLFYCGNSPEADRSKPDGVLQDNEQADQPKPAAEAPGARQAVGFRIQAVNLSPAAPTTATDLSAQAVLSESVPGSVVFQYRWFVNDKQVMTVAGADLPRAHFRKKQWVYCLAKAIVDEKESNWLMSKRVRIANAPPQLTESPVTNFTVPGEFTYQISASDPDQDPLTYELQSPLDLGIALDAKTGLLNWKIAAEAITNLSDAIEIRFAVSDGDGGKTSAAINLNLTK